MPEPYGVRKNRNTLCIWEKVKQKYISLSGEILEKFSGNTFKNSLTTGFDSRIGVSKSISFTLTRGKCNPKK